MIERIVSLSADYLSTVGALARTEAVRDMALIRDALRARIVAWIVLGLGALWLNVAVLIWLLSTPHALVGALSIGVVCVVAGFVMSAGSRRALGSLRVLDGTRGVLADEFGGRRPGAPRDASPPAPVSPEQAGARLHAIRESLRETVSIHRGPQGDHEPVDAAARFEPRSRSMRRLMWVWRVLPRVPASTVMFSALGVLAISSPRLRRLLAVMALLRNLGGHPRRAAQGASWPSYPS